MSRIYKFSRLVGNTTSKNIIMKSLCSSGFPQVSSFTGDSGTGKSSSAEISALRLTCITPNGAEPCGLCESCIQSLQALQGKGTSRKIKKVNLAHIQENTDVKKLIQEVFQRDNGGEVTVRIFEEAHSLSVLHQTALLEEIDRIPDDVYVMIVTTKPASLIQELRNRTVEFRFSKLTPKQSNLLIDSECLRLGLKLSESTKNLIRLHSKGVARELVKSLEFIGNNRNAITEAEFSEYFGDMDTNVIRMMFKSYLNIGECMKSIDTLLEKANVQDFIYKVKDYLMNCAFLSKDVSYRETVLSAEDKRFSKSLGFSCVMKLFSQIDSLPANSSLVDLQFCMIKCCGLVASTMKSRASSLGLDSEDVVKTSTNSIAVDLESKRAREEVLKESSSFSKKMSSSAFEDIINENVSKS